MGCSNSTPRASLNHRGGGADTDSTKAAGKRRRRNPKRNSTCKCRSDQYAQISLWLASISGSEHHRCPAPTTEGSLTSGNKAESHYKHLEVVENPLLPKSNSSRPADDPTLMGTTTMRAIIMPAAVSAESEMACGADDQNDAAAFRQEEDPSIAAATAMTSPGGLDPGVQKPDGHNDDEKMEDSGWTSMQFTISESSLGSDW